MFPTVEEYQTALLTSREGPLRSLRLEPVLTATGEVEQETGSYSVVFRMRSIDDPGQEWAMKCYVADQERRLTSCRAIIEYLTSISSPYLLPLHLYENECYCQGQYYPIVLLPWVEGDSLVNYVRKWIDAPERLEKLSHDFGLFACWLRRQSFAHGDLKSDNLRIRPQGELVLLDYDGLYIPTMQGEPPREEGNPDYTHPLYQSTDFNEHVGDFALSVIALSLRALVLSPTLFRDLEEIDTCYYRPKTSSILRNPKPSKLSPLSPMIPTSNAWNNSSVKLWKGATWPIPHPNDSFHYESVQPTTSHHPPDTFSTIALSKGTGYRLGSTE